MRAIDTLLAGLIDYAGLYPPASLHMGSAVRNYLNYRQGKYAPFLGRFVADLNRLTELRQAAGGSIHEMKLSVIGSATSSWDSLLRLLEDGFTIEMVEIKSDQPADIERISKLVPQGIPAYFEVPLSPQSSEALEAVSGAGARVKVRMGGVVPEAFPSPDAVTGMLQALARRHLPFKATAGLHHAIRSLHLFTYDPDSSCGVMHGFFNLCCAAALLHSGGEAEEARRALEEQNGEAWRVTPDAIGWRSLRWTADQLRAVREQFLTSFGSCSFDEPIRELEGLGWL